MKLVKSFVLTAVLAAGLATGLNAQQGTPARSTTQIVTITKGALLFVHTTIESCDGFQLVIAFSDGSERKMHIQRERSEKPGTPTVIYVEYDPKKVYIAAIHTMAYLIEGLQ